MTVKDRMKRSKISKITTYHYVKFVGRLLLCLAVICYYIVKKVDNTQIDPLLDGIKSNKYLGATLLGIWVIFVIETLLRFFPSKLESIGCQKQFKRNYIPEEPTEKPIKQSGWRTFAVTVAWIALNAVFVTLYFTKVIDGGVLIILSLLYSVGDMVCILFFCPFQVLFMKNRCCVSCRIYNWDYPMMFTPIVFIKNAFCISIFVLALALVVVWEILYRKYPERFCRNTNKSLSCANCKEKLCKHKTHLQSFIKKFRP